MFKNLGEISYLSTTRSVEIDLKDICEGNNYTEEFIIYKKNNQINVYDRLCDHNSGKLISKNNKTFCPMHNWEFFPEIGKYKNGLNKKKKKILIFNNKISVIEEKFQPKIKTIDMRIELKVRYINHAFLIIESNDFKFATDPWALGPAFNTGWWLKHKTIADWKDELNSCDFIFISHNHPDHCHELTLSHLNKDIPILVPNFLSDSTGLLISDLGFKKIYRIEFEIQYQFKNTPLIFTIFKSGDLREDSGLYFSAGKFTGLLTVDANNLNFLKLPKVDLFASSFAGGAHGYPLNCENYELRDRVKMINKDINFIKQTKFKYIKQIKPKFFLPYAGFFIEKLSRDEIYIKYNKKNKTSDFNDICKKYNIQLLDPEKKNIFFFNKKKICKSFKFNGKYAKDLNPEKYLQYFTKKYNKIDLNYLKNYFINSSFHDGTKLYISITNAEFNKSELNFKINFTKEIDFSIINDPINKHLKIDDNYLYLKIRKEAFLKYNLQ
jgi:CMP-N-acetylneuraminate monooxygenase